MNSTQLNPACGRAGSPLNTHKKTRAKNIYQQARDRKIIPVSKVKGGVMDPEVEKIFPHSNQKMIVD